MSTMNEISDGNLAPIPDGLVAMPPEEFLTNIKELSTETIGEIQKLGTLSEEQLGAIDIHLKNSTKPAKKISIKRAAPSASDGYVPLKERLNAWWRGDDVTFNKTKSKSSKKSIILPDDNDPRRWNPNSIRMSEELWGEGFVEPGGAAFAKKMLSPLKLDASNSVLDLSAGLGGTASILAKEHKIWLDALEPNEECATAGKKYVSRVGLAKKIPIQHTDFETLELPEKKYDQVFSRDALFTVENKKNVMQQIAKCLKKRGQIILVDYMLEEPGRAGELKSWEEKEREKPHLWTADLYQNALSHYGLSVWSINDFSKEYLEEVHLGWSTVIARINEGDFDRKFVNFLLREGDVWLHRVRAIESGALTVKRIHAVL